MYGKSLKKQAAKWEGHSRRLRGLLYDAHNLDGFEIPILWAQLIMDVAMLCDQIAKAYRFGRPALPADPVWSYTTHKDSPLWRDEDDIPF